MSGSKKKTYVVLHPDGTYSTRTSTKDTVYTAAIVRVMRLAEEHDHVNVKGARECRREAAECRAKAAGIGAGRYECTKAEPFIYDRVVYTYQDTQFPQNTERIYAASSEEADKNLAERAEYYLTAAENMDGAAITKEATPPPASDAVEYGRAKRDVMYRSDVTAAEAECDRLNAKTYSYAYFHVAGVHVVPDGTKPAEYVKALQVPF